MRMKLVLAAAAAALAALAGAAGAAGKGIVYTFTGKLSATPSNGDISITIQAANLPALRALLGQPVDQTFSYGSSTERIRRCHDSVTRHNNRPGLCSAASNRERGRVAMTSAPWPRRSVMPSSPGSRR